MSDRAFFQIAASIAEENASRIAAGGLHPNERPFLKTENAAELCRRFDPQLAALLLEHDELTVAIAKRIAEHIKQKREGKR